jgi:hypothetical protein
LKNDRVGGRQLVNSIWRPFKKNRFDYVDIPDSCGLFDGKHGDRKALDEEQGGIKKEALRPPFSV